MPDVAVPADLGVVAWQPDPCVWGAQMHSCSSSVLVNQTADQVPSMQSAWAILADRGHVGWIWCMQAQRSVRAVPVVVLDVDAQGLLEMISS
jgi:hypothetical protein